MTERLVRAAVGSLPDFTSWADVVLVVTADRGLRRLLPPEALIVGPEWLNRVIGR